MLRNVVFQLHWMLGITAGLVLAVMGVSGALISFEDEILAALNPGVVRIDPAGTPPLAPTELARRIEAQKPGARITRLIFDRDPEMAAWASYVDKVSKKRNTTFVDPATGTLLGEGRGHGFFEAVTALHRWLALPGSGNGIGRQITGFSAIALIFFALSGLYLRWPKRLLDWRVWLTLDLRKTGRNLHRALHVTVGSWVLIFYLVSASTGLWWSYGWYRDGANYLLAGDTVDLGQKRPAGERKTPAAFATAWAGFERATGGRHYSAVTVTLRDNGEVQFRAKLPHARHDRVSDELTIDGATGETLSVLPYAGRTVGQDIVTSIFEIHRGAYFGLAGRIGIALASLMMPLFTLTGFLLYFSRRRRKRALALVMNQATVDVPHASEAATLVAFASQTGTAERIARLTADALPGAAVLPIAQLDETALGHVERLLIVVSTYGDGEPPDLARSFARNMMASHRDLSHVRYAVLALGDREYSDFCAFGHRLDRWLHEGGARRLFDLIEMDGDDPDAQRHWQQQLAGLGARTDQPDWAFAPMQDWRLVERRLLNPGSSGGPVFHVALEPMSPGSTRWLPGDILEVEPRNDPGRIDAFLAAGGSDAAAASCALLEASILPGSAGNSFDSDQLRPIGHREYSIASIMGLGRVELLVRQCVNDDGFLGLGSGWLTEFAPPGGVIRARIRSNPAFHPPADLSTPLILIGNGTGLAGLLAHLRHRAVSGGAAAWLFWGERHPDYDAHHGEELRGLCANGTFAVLEYAWSRLPGEQNYIQDRLSAYAFMLRSQVNAGAAIYVCGSVLGMAPGVDKALRSILGDRQLEEMVEQGRYRRDIY